MAGYFEDGDRSHGLWVDAYVDGITLAVGVILLYGLFGLLTVVADGPTPLTAGT